MQGQPAVSQGLTRTRTELSTVLYWLSMLLLIWGGRTLIDPSHRRSGEVAHIYITLAAFEAYVWLLLVVARWQTGRNLHRDAARFGLFAIFLQGLVFMAVNELHMAAQGQGLVMTFLCVALASAKVLLGTRWMRIPLPAPLAASCLIWIVVMALPGIVMRSFGIDYAKGDFAIDYPAQHATGFVSCWAVAILAGLHLLLVNWQSKRGFASPIGLRPWWTPWAASAGLLAMAIAQLYTAMWGLWVDWAQWFFSPIYLGIGVVVVALSLAARKHRRFAWALLAIAAMHFWITYGEAPPERIPASWREGIGAYVMHPLYLTGGYVSVLFAATAWLLRRPILWLVAAAAPAAGGAYWLCRVLAKPMATGTERALNSLASSRYVKGVAMLLGAFVLLGAGVALQWRRERRKSMMESLRPPSPPQAEKPDDGPRP